MSLLFCAFDSAAHVPEDLSKPWNNVDESHLPYSHDEYKYVRFWSLNECHCKTFIPFHTFNPFFTRIYKSLNPFESKVITSLHCESTIRVKSFNLRKLKMLKRLGSWLHRKRESLEQHRQLHNTVHAFLEITHFIAEYLATDGQWTLRLNICPTCWLKIDPSM